MKAVSEDEEEEEVEERKGRCDTCLKLYSAIIKNKIMYLQKWIQLKIITLSGLGQIKVDKWHSFPLICGP